jgi:hypothetical protein
MTTLLFAILLAPCHPEEWWQIIIIDIFGICQQFCTELQNKNIFIA